MAQDVPIKPSGNDPIARFMRAVWEELWGRKLVPFVVPQQTVVNTKSAPSSSSRPFQFVQSWGDYVIGKDMVYGTLTPIAKPFKHRNSNTTEWDNGVAFQLTYPQNVKVGSPPTWNTLAFISRTKTNGSYVELQRITPGWTAAKSGTNQVADIFYASQLTQGGTGITTDPQDTNFPPGTPVVWLDDNRDGRAWGATPDGNP